MARLWTILIYLAGDNNLDNAALDDRGEMKAVGSTPEVAVVAQIDRSGDDGAQRYLVTPGTGELDGLAADRVATLPEVNTGDPVALLEFVRWGMATYPADHVALILWNHGAGWKDDDIYRRTRDAGWDARDAPHNSVRRRGPLTRR